MREWSFVWEHKLSKCPQCGQRTTMPEDEVYRMVLRSNEYQAQKVIAAACDSKYCSPKIEAAR